MQKSKEKKEKKEKKQTCFQFRKKLYLCARIFGM